MKNHNSNGHDHHKSTEAPSALNPAAASLKDYVPLIVVFAFVLLSSFLHIYNNGSTAMNWMAAIMGYFFVYFSLFKLIDLPGFADGFVHYDVVAAKLKPWAYLYPFIELLLGALYLAGVSSSLLHITAIAISFLNVISVLIKISKKERFMCACLGTVLKVPLTTVTLIEYGIMGMMSIYMLIL